MDKDASELANLGILGEGISPTMGSLRGYNGDDRSTFERYYQEYSDRFLKILKTCHWHSALTQLRKLVLGFSYGRGLLSLLRLEGENFGLTTRPNYN